MQKKRAEAWFGLFFGELALDRAAAAAFPGRAAAAGGPPAMATPGGQDETEGGDADHDQCDGSLPGVHGSRMARRGGATSGAANQ